MSTTTTPTSQELSVRTIEIVKATKPLLAEHGLAITTRLYERLFISNPELEMMFSGAGSGQAAKLAQAIVSYADHIDNTDALTPVVGQIAARHVAAGVKSEHYAIVGLSLLGAMIDVMGDLDAEVIEAWGEAYDFLAHVFIAAEADLVASSTS